jgi:KUP system potassium uptake protein
MTDASTARSTGSRSLAPLALGALGVVYGDLGTSPLYTLQACFAGAHGVAPTEANILGITSLIFWSIILVITVKYVLFVMRADNHGEGGILALMAMAETGARGNARLIAVIALLGLFGAALFYGDGMITPAISVLSAVEGLEVAEPNLQRFVIPITLAVLLLLFAYQRRGTSKVGALFGPVMLVWFAVLALLGLRQIVARPGILEAVDPVRGIDYLAANGFGAFLSLGAVVLALTGAEALYADMGHFGARPIRIAWFSLVLPALLLNYFGQAALLLASPDAAKNPFYLMAPDWALYPLIGLATAATVIASQAVITGVFSLSRQAVQLGYCPRLEVRQTSKDEYGQIYIPRANWGLLLAIIVLVVGFRSSDALAAAYGIAVTGTMLITTLLAVVVARRIWHWRLIACLVVGIGFSIVDGAYFLANLWKFVDGGWFPLAIGALVFLLMATWKRGRAILSSRLRASSLDIDAFLATVSPDHPPRVPGTAVFMTGGSDYVPVALLHNMKHNKVLHERVVFLTVVGTNVPWVADARRVEVEVLPKRFYRVIVRYGFMETPDIPAALELCKDKGLEFATMETSFFLGRETLIPSVQPEMALWREKLFVAMSRNAVSATDFFKIPANRVVELGTQVQI